MSFGLEEVLNTCIRLQSINRIPVLCTADMGNAVISKEIDPIPNVRLLDVLI